MTTQYWECDICNTNFSYQTDVQHQPTEVEQVHELNIAGEMNWLCTKCYDDLGKASLQLVKDFVFNGEGMKDDINWPNHWITDEKAKELLRFYGFII